MRKSPASSIRQRGHSMTDAVSASGARFAEETGNAFVAPPAFENVLGKHGYGYDPEQSTPGQAVYRHASRGYRVHVTRHAIRDPQHRLGRHPIYSTSYSPRGEVNHPHPEHLDEHLKKLHGTP